MDILSIGSEGLKLSNPSSSILVAASCLLLGNVYTSLFFNMFLFVVGSRLKMSSTFVAVSSSSADTTYKYFVWEPLLCLYRIGLPPAQTGVQLS